MKNKYIRTVLDKGTFLVESNITWVDGSVYKLKFKIDTGCTATCIPIRSLGLSREEAKKFKRDALDKGVRYRKGYGVSDTQETKDRDNELIAQGMEMECTALKFEHTISDVTIGGMYMGDMLLGINYDRTGNILLGMDVLMNWDIHIGKSEAPEDNGKTVFLACPYDKLNEDYFKELDRTFLLSTTATKFVSEED